MTEIPTTIERFVVQIRLSPWSDNWMDDGFASDPIRAQEIADRRLSYLQSKDRIQPSPIEVRVVHRTVTARP